MPQVLNPNGKLVNADAKQLPALEAAGWKVKPADIEAYLANPAEKEALKPADQNTPPAPVTAPQGQKPTNVPQGQKPPQRQR